MATKRRKWQSLESATGGCAGSEAKQGFNCSNNMMRIHPRVPSGFAWLEVLLALALLALLFQLFPSLWVGTLWALDVRNWPRTVWFAGNLMVVLTLVAIRFGPDLYQDWRERRDERATERAKREKQQELKEQRETLERMKEAQKRRVY